MNTRWRAVATLALVALIITVIWQAVAAREPVYQGRTLRAWLEEAARHDRVDPPAERAVRTIGIASLPTLLKLIQTRDSAFRQSLMDLRSSQSWVPIRVRPAGEMQDMGVYGFTILGPAAKPAVPELVRLLRAKDSRVRACAAFSLAKIGPNAKAAVPALLQYLAQAAKTKPGVASGPLDRLCAPQALAEMGSRALPGIPDLCALTNSSDPGVGFAARAAVIKIRGDSIEPLVAALRNYSNQTNWFQAAGVLGFLGTNAEPVLPELLPALRQTNSLIQNEAVRLLGKIHARPELSIPALMPFLQSTNTWTRADCLGSLRAFGADAKPWEPVAEITRCLNDSDGLVRREATNTLRQIDPDVSLKLK